MAAATLNLNVVERRMLTASQAADYCGLATRHFKALCPVPTVMLAGRFPLYDKRDLDDWIEAEKTGAADASQDAIVGRLA